MDVGKMTLEELRDGLIRSARKGYPIFVAGALYWLVLLLLSFVLKEKTLALWYILGMGTVFPLGLLVSKLLRVDFLSTHNPLSTLGGIVGGIQAFFLPVYIVIYMERADLVPFMVGMLCASHFLPYMWIYKSRTYLFLTVGMVVCSFVFGYVLRESAFLLIPLSACLIYSMTVIGLVAETRAHDRMSVKAESVSPF